MVTRRLFTWEYMGLQLEVDALRWRITVRSDCVPDVRAALGEVAEIGGAAHDLNDATHRGLIALGRVAGWAQARRRPEQRSMLEAERVEDLGELAGGTVEAAWLAFEAGKPEVAAAIVARARERLRAARFLRPQGEKMARALADATAAELRRRGHV